jgi:predicted phosphate transport protein (TIGR00153 family)
MRFLPREEKFYADFLLQVSIIKEASAILLNGVQHGNSHMEKAAAEIKTLELKGDELIHDIFLRLNQTFLTPLDPEDIHKLASHLDDVLDCIEESAYRMVAYPLEPIPEPVKRITELVQQCVLALDRAFLALSKDEKFMDHCVEVNRLENETDDVFRSALKELFRTETNAIELIKRKEVYEVLEKATDYCENVADVLQEVMVKNS